MSILGKLFGSADAIEKTREGVFNGIDKAILTKEEKLDYNLMIMQAYEAFKVAQRLLALTFGIPYSIAWFITFIVSFFQDVTQQQLLLKGTMGEIVLAIVAFYFLGGVANGYISIRDRVVGKKKEGA